MKTNRERSKFKRLSAQTKSQRRRLMLERLENRDLLVATITGTVFLDSNLNGQRDGVGLNVVSGIELGTRGPVILENNDDGSTARLDLGFTFDFYGQSFTQTYINNNGNITFSSALSQYSPSGFPQSRAIVAPFWADVDTRDGLGTVHQSRGLSPRGRPYFQVDWVDVGKYNRVGEFRNDFSVYIEDDPAGDIVAFFYRSMGWTNESVGAQIGFDSGNNSNFLSFARPASTEDLAFLNNVQYAFRIAPNGTPEPVQLEAGLAGAVVYVDANANGVRDANELFATASADNSGTISINEAGRFRFDSLQPGTYLLRQELPNGYTGTAPATGSRTVTVTNSGIIGGQDFGRAEVAELSGRAFVDANRNSREDASDPSLPGATVYLDINDDGIRDTNEPFAITGLAGEYRFQRLPVGQYAVRVKAADERAPVVPSNGRRSVTLAAGDRRTDVNFGFATKQPPRIVGITPAPLSDIANGVSKISVTFDTDIDPAARWGGLFELIAAGGDGRFDTGNERTVDLTFESWDSSTRTMHLTPGEPLSRDVYRLKATDSLIDTLGNNLDGEYRGRLPTGDGSPGGDFVMEFHVTNDPPRSLPYSSATSQVSPLTVQLNATDSDGIVSSFRIVRAPTHGTLVGTGNLGEYLYTPDGIYAGIDTFRFVASDGVAESPEQEGRIVVARAPIDLAPVSMNVVSNTPVAAGRPITLAWHVQNLGPGATNDSSGEDWYDELYLSNDDQLDAQDVHLASVAVNRPAISQSGTYNVEHIASLPFLERSGSAFIVLQTNRSGWQYETNRTNNLLALPITLQPTIDLTMPWGVFLGKQKPNKVTWRDADLIGDGTIDIAIDTDADPSNGLGQVILASGISENGDNAGDAANVVLPANLNNGEYYLWARLNSSIGPVYSLPVKAQVFEEVFLGEDNALPVVGGGSYEVFGVDIARSGDNLQYRVRTNYNPLSNGGDVYINVGGSFATGGGRLAGIAVRDRTTSTGQIVRAGQLYSSASFLGGSIRKQHPIFLQRYESAKSNVASANVTTISDQNWKYEINGQVSLAALGASENDSIEVGWGMYCGNDFSATDNDKPRLNLLGAGFAIQPPAGNSSNQSRRWGDSVTVKFHVANQGNADAGATRVRFVVSPDSTIQLADQSLTVESGSVNIPALPVGQSYGGEVTLKLPTNPPAGFEPTGTIYLGMISDSDNSIDESSETDNFNFAFGFDKDDLRIGNAEFVNILIHGYELFSYNNMWSQWQGFGNELKRFAEESGNDSLKNNVENYVTEWRSAEGWDSAFVAVLGYAALEVAKAFEDDSLTIFSMEKLQDIFLADAENSMRRAEAVARQAASQTVAMVRSSAGPGKAPVLGLPSDNQWIHVIGHSRGGAVGAEVVRQLRSQGYNVAQFTTLDGYSNTPLEGGKTDWPYPSNILGDIDIVGTVARGGAQRQVNYRVEQGLAAAVVSTAEAYLESALSDILDDPTIDINFASDFLNKYADWRAQERAGFTSVVMPDSNHISIDDQYFDRVNRSEENPYKALLDAAASRGGSTQSGEGPGTQNLHTLTDHNFTDGSFDNVGRVRQMLSQFNSIPTFNNTLADTILRVMEQPGFGIDTSLDVGGDYQLVVVNGNPVLQLGQTNETFFQESIELGPTANQLSFRSAVTAAGPGDELVVSFENEVIARYSLSSLVGAGFQQSTIDISQLAGRIGTFRFMLVGPTSSPSTIQLDDLKIQNTNPWHNFANPLDVTANGTVTPADALQVINFLNSDRSRILTDLKDLSPPYVDVDGNGRVSANDALQVINWLNQRSSGGEAEGEVASVDLVLPAIQRIQPIADSSEFHASTATYPWREQVFVTSDVGFTHRSDELILNEYSVGTSYMQASNIETSWAHTRADSDVPKNSEKQTSSLNELASNADAHSPLEIDLFYADFEH